MKVALGVCPHCDPDKPPISLAYLGSYLREREIEVLYFDFNIDLYSDIDSKKKVLWNKLYEDKNIAEETIDESLIQRWLKEIEKISPQIIGFSLVSTNVYSTFKLAEKIKGRYSDIKIVFGGPEVYRYFGLNNHTIFDYADALVLGEGEEIFYKLILGYIKNGEIKADDGIVVKKDNILLGRENYNLISNIDKVPFPNYDQFPLYKYKEKGQQFPLIFSRGCLGRCSFCFERAYWKRFRCRSVENVIEEIKEIGKRYNIWNFSLNDSLANGDMQFLSEFCDKIIIGNIKIKWWGMARINNQMTEQFLNKMSKAGCVSISYGIESGSQKVLNLMKKGLNVSIIDQVLLNTYKAGIRQGINLIVGFPGEEDKDFQKTCELIKRSGEYISYVNIAILGIEPFTDIYRDVKVKIINFRDVVHWEIPYSKNNYNFRIERADKLSQMVSRYVKQVSTL